MKTNNHGYTFVELLITIAIFSIVIVSIASMMSNASKTYKKGVFENQVQQDAQIAVNQISDIICDSEKMLSASEAAPADFGFVIDSSASENIYLKKTGDKLYITKNKDDADSYEIISDNVTSFDIENNNFKDNICVVKLSLNEENASYDASKEVHFRNNFESNPYKTMLSSSSTTPDPDPDESGFAGTIDVKRGQKINLSADYGYGIYQISSDAETYFKVTEGTAFGKNSYVLEVADTYVNPGNFGQKVTATDSVYLGKYSEDDEGNLTLDKKYKLKMDEVSISANSGILLLTPDEVNVGAGGNTTYISCKGIDVNGFLGLTGASGSYVITVDGDGLPLAGSDTNVISKNLSAVSGNTPYNAGSDVGDMFKVDGNPINFNINLSADQCSNGMAITTGNKGFKGNPDKVKDKDVKANIVITFKKSSQEKQYTLDYKIQTTTYQDIGKFNP